MTDEHFDPMARVGDAIRAEFEAKDAEITRLQAERDAAAEALQKIHDHDGVSYRFGDEIREIARTTLASIEGPKP